MSLPMPNLDDRNFEDLMKEALSLIPVYDKEWTNYNPSDPGITLLELFSWLSELTIYRIDRVQEENYRKFLELLGIKHLFKWNEIPGNESDLIEFLAETYEVDWVKIAKIEKTNDGKAINIHFENNSILLKLGDKGDKEEKVTIQLDNGTTHDLDVKKELRVYESVKSGTAEGWLFRWDKVPGADKNKLIEYFIRKDGKLSWLYDASLEKIDNGKTLNFFSKNQSGKTQYITIHLNDEENKVTVYESIDPGTPERKYEFDVVKDLKIYDAIESDIKRGLESISKRYRAITSDDFEFLANECIETLQKGLAGRAICVNNSNLEYGKILSSNSQPGHVSVILIPGAEKPEFSWDDIPGKSNIQLIGFLHNIYGTDWIKSAKVEKSEDGNTITISEFPKTETTSDSIKSILLKMSLKKVNLESYFSVQYSDELEFDWDEIPGKDNVLLLEFLEKIYGANWIKSAKIEKSVDDNTITISKITNNEIDSDGITYISLKTDQKKKTFESRLYSSYAKGPDFLWDHVPGKDNDQFFEFLAKIYGADWIKSAKVEKSADGDTITISKFSNVGTASDSVQSISVTPERKVTLESQFYASYEFIANMEQGKLNVYCYTVNGRPSDLLKDQVRKYLNKRKLVTTKLHVVAPDYRKATLSACISLKADALEDKVIEEANKAISKCFDSLEGGKDSKGWPVGRNIYRSEIYQLLESITGVDYVIAINIDNSAADSVELKEYQLIELTAVKIEVCDE